MNFDEWRKSVRKLALKYSDLPILKPKTQPVPRTTRSKSFKWTIGTRLPVLILDRNFEEGMQEQPLGPAEQVFKDRKSYLTYYGGDTWFIQYDIDSAEIVEQPIHIEINVDEWVPVKHDNVYCQNKIENNDGIVYTIVQPDENYLIECKPLDHIMDKLIGWRGMIIPWSSLAQTPNLYFHNWDYWEHPWTDSPVLSSDILAYWNDWIIELQWGTNFPIENNSAYFGIPNGSQITIMVDGEDEVGGFYLNDSDPVTIDVLYWEILDYLEYELRWDRSRVNNSKILGVREIFYGRLLVTMSFHD